LEGEEGKNPDNFNLFFVPIGREKKKMSNILKKKNDPQSGDNQSNAREKRGKEKGELLTSP